MRQLRGVLILLSSVFCILNGPRPAEAQVGPAIVEIQLDEEGRVVNDSAVLRLIETRVGDRLSVRSVRETIAHLMALGRYEDVRVESEPVGNGVRVKYMLMPRHPIDRITFVGRTELPEESDAIDRMTRRTINAAASASERPWVLSDTPAQRTPGLVRRASLSERATVSSIDGSA